MRRCSPLVVLALVLPLVVSCGAEVGDPLSGLSSAAGSDISGAAVVTQTMPSLVLFPLEVAKIPLGVRLSRARVVDWRSSDETVATVDRNGQLSTKRVGSVSVVARAGGTVETTPVRIAVAERLDVLTPKLSIVTGERINLRSRVISASGDTVTPRSVVWTVKSGGAVQLGVDGSVLGVAAGSSTVAATVGEVTGTAVITVAVGGSSPEVPRVVSFQIAPRSAAVQLGDKIQFSTTTQWSDGATRVTQITYTASGGTVNVAGFFTASQIAGAVSVVASCACGRVDTAAVTVSAQVAPPPPSSGVVELPRVYLDGMVAEARNAAASRTITVANGTGFQRALDTAKYGDHIVLLAGVTYTGSFVLRAKSGSGWITIRSSAPQSSLPPAGGRMRPSLEAFLPKLEAAHQAESAISTEAGASGYRIFAVEVRPPGGATDGSALVSLGTHTSEQTTVASTPARIVLDRVYVHGSSEFNFRRCIALNSASTAIVDSWISDCHSRGFDSQAIWGANGPGPYKITNNYLEGAGENIMFGGADPKVVNQLPADIEIRQNHFFKPSTWTNGRWTVKNLFELKIGLRVLIEGNVFENNWADGQTGFAIVLKSSHEENTAPWSQTADVTFRSNVVKNVAHGFSAAGTNTSESFQAVPMVRVLVQNNLFERIGDGDFAGGVLWQASDMNDLTISNNTGFGRTDGLRLYGSRKMLGFVLRDNILGALQSSYGTWDYALASADGRGFGDNALAAHATGWVMAKNVVPSVTPSRFPDTHIAAHFAGIGFVSWPTNARLASSSPFLQASSTGGVPGADISLLEQATRGVVISP